MRDNKTTQTGNGNSNRGFASMPHEKVEEIARKGGEASAQKAGHEGMAERGRKGGESSGNRRSDDAKD
jgi:general stress protein YciG